MSVPAFRVASSTRISLAVVAISAAGLGLLSFGFGDFAPSGAILPNWLPWRDMWVRLAATILLLASVGLCIPRTALCAGYAVGAYQLIWVAIGTPPIVSAPLNIGAWYGFVEALTALVGTLILCATLRRDALGLAMPTAGEHAVRAAQVSFGMTCIFYGCSHFAYADYTAAMVPHGLPGRLQWAYFTGGAHVVAGLAVAAGVLPRLAATLEATMMSLFGLLVWVPTFLLHAPPAWAMPPKNRWSELVVNIALAASAWVVALSFGRSAPPNRK